MKTPLPMPIHFSKENWENFYDTGNTPWDRPVPQEELIQIIKEYGITPCNVLDIGCGTGSSSIELARHGYNVTAIDISSKAIDIARSKINSQRVDFKVCDILSDNLNSVFDFAIDIGCFHHNFNDKFVKIVSNNLRDRGIWFSTIGSAERRPIHISPPAAPPAYSIQDILNLTDPLFETISIKTFNDGGGGFSFWSCLMCKR